METVIFDLGGVLIDWNPKYVFDKVFSSKEEVDFFLTQVCSHNWNIQQDRGRTFAEGITLKQKDFPDYADQIPLYFERWSDMIGGAMGKTVEILKSLYDKREVRLYALTNWSAETFPYAWENFSFLRLFEGILVSGKEKLIKPDPAIYHLLLQRYDIRAATCVFIDDSVQNVLAASCLGIHGIHFSTAEELTESLRAVGISV